MRRPLNIAAVAIQGNDEREFLAIDGAADGATSQSRQLYLLNFDCRIVKPPTRMTWIGSVPANKFRASMFSRAS